MPIVIQYGGEAMVGLGREAGKEQGKAQANALLGQGIADGLKNAAIGIQQSLNRRHEEKLANQEREFRAQQNDKQISYYRERDAVDDKRQQDIADFNKTNADRTYELNKRQADALNADRKATRYSNLIKAGGQAIADAGRGALAQSQARVNEAKLKQMETQQVELDQIKTGMLDWLDSEYTNKETGKLESDANYMVQRAHIISGNFDKVDTKSVPSAFISAGRAYQPKQASENDMDSIAMANPAMAIKLATEVDVPPTGSPADAQPQISKNAVAMGAALARLPYSPRFDPKANPNYFQELKETVQRYKDAGADPALVGPLEQRYQELAIQRSQTILPRVIQEVDQIMENTAAAAAGKTMGTRDWWTTARSAEIQKRLRAYGITPQEFKEWAQVQATATQLFSAPGGQPSQQGQRPARGQGQPQNNPRQSPASP